MAWQNMKSGDEVIVVDGSTRRLDRQYSGLVKTVGRKWITVTDMNGHDPRRFDLQRGYSEHDYSTHVHTPASLKQAQEKSRLLRVIHAVGSQWNNMSVETLAAVVELLEEETRKGG